MDNYVCSICKKVGSRKDIPYKIIYNPDDKCKFKEQLCEDCYRTMIDKMKERK